MAITLAEAKVGMADKVDQQIVDMFRRSSLLLDRAEQLFLPKAKCKQNPLTPPRIPIPHRGMGISVS